jgi:hypothetical protein
MVYRPPYPWYIDPLPMVYRPLYPRYIDPPSRGISTSYPWYIGPLGIVYRPLYPWYIDPTPIRGILTPPTHGISTLLPMVYRPQNPWYFEPHTYGISNPLLWYYELLSFGRNERGFSLK